MIKLTHKKKKVEIPDKWDDLSPQQFVMVVKFALMVQAGEIDMLDFRRLILRLLTGYKAPRRFTYWKHREDIESNLLNLAMMLKFPIVPVYTNPELLEVFTSDLRQILKTSFPFDIYEADYCRQLDMVGGDLKWRPEINHDFVRNMLPVINCGFKNYYGPVFNLVENGSFETDITTAEYFDALDELQMYESSKNENYLHRFIATLYRPVREEGYCAAKTSKLASKLAKIDNDTKNALLELWLWYSKVIQQHHLYSVFFIKGEQQNNGNPLGLSATLFALSTDGFGSRDEIRSWPLTEFFNSLYYRLHTAVNQLRREGIDEFKISKELQLDLETLNKL